MYKYISDMITLPVIQTWKRGENIMIRAQTGKGKSHFIINILAQHAKELNLKILILSNRDLLKQQNQKLALDNVECYNYQFLEKLDQEQLDRFLQRFDIINFDECHYFFKDSAFNENTERVLLYALKPTNQIKLFASATPEPLYHTGIEFQHEYTLPADYSFIERIEFYDELPEVMNKILESPDKTICFLSNAAYACKLTLTHYDQMKFICSKSNPLWKVADKKVAEDIVQNSSFKTKILITTTVLDNGVNIIDKKVKNVLIDFYDPITIIQALGRKRIQPGEKIVLYLRNPNRKSVNRGRFSKTLQENLPAQIYRRYLNQYFEDINKIGYIPYWFSYFKISDQKIEYHTTHTELKNFLEARVNKPVEKEELEEEFGRVTPIKKDARLCTYNNFLKKNMIPYEIVPERYRVARNKKKTKWIVKSTK